MEYKRFNNTIVARLEKGEEVITKIKEIAQIENIKLAQINALGATNNFVVGAYDLNEHKYYQNEYSGAYEIVSLHGNISTMNNEVYLHIHMGAGDKNGNYYGGHLNKAIISATCEIFIDIIDGEVDRIKDPDTGLNVYKFK